MPPLARRLFLPDTPAGATGASLVMQGDNTINWTNGSLSAIAANPNIDPTGNTPSGAAMFTANEIGRAAGQDIFYPPGTYLIDQRIYNQASSLGYTIRGAGPGRTIFQLSPSLTTEILGCLGSAPVVGSAPFLTSPAAASQSVINMPTAGVNVGDVLLLRDTAQVIFSNAGRTATGYIGEYAKVYQINSSSQLTVYGVLENSYATATTDVRKHVTYGPITIRDLTIQGPTPFNGYTGSGIVFSYGANTRVQNVEFKNMCSNGIYHQWCRDAQVIGCNFDTFYDLETTNAPYCVTWAKGCQGLTMFGCRGRYGRHMITCFGDPADNVAAHADIIGCQGIEFACPFDSHPAARQIRFYDCHAIKSLSFGYQFRGPDNAAYNCTSTGAGQYGINIIFADRARVVGGRYAAAGITALNVQDSDDTFIVGDVLLDSPTTTAIGYVANDAAYNTFVTKFTLGNVKVTGSPTNGVNNAANLTPTTVGAVTGIGGLTNTNYSPILWQSSSTATEAASATAGAATLPANPVGFFIVQDHAGTLRKVPYYAT